MIRRRPILAAVVSAVFALTVILLGSLAWAAFTPNGGTGSVSQVFAPPPISYSNSAVLSFSDLDATQSLNFECNLDGNGWQNCNLYHSPGSGGYWGQLIMPDLNPGNHTVKIRTNGSDSGSYSWEQVPPTPAMICSRWRDWQAPQTYLIQNPDVTVCPDFVQTDAIYKKNFPEPGYPELPRCRPNVCN